LRIWFWADGEAKPGKKEVVTITKFKESEGMMSAMCWCKGHDLEGRIIYDMHEIDPEQNEVGRTRKEGADF
jgi:hypothetical protein